MKKVYAWLLLAKQSENEHMEKEPMTQDHTLFESAVDTVLNHIVDQLEAHHEAFFEEIDLHQGILTLKLMNGKTFVMNRHGASGQMWYASPVSGAAHFCLQEGAWVSTRDSSVRFPQLLASELSQLIQKPVAF